MLLLVRYLFVALRVLLGKRRLDLTLENVALRHQLEVLARSRRRAPLRPADRLLWSWLARLWPGWRRHLVTVQPETVTRWHRTAGRRYWAWRSGGRRRGRPCIEPPPSITSHADRTHKSWSQIVARGPDRLLR